MEINEKIINIIIDDFTIESLIDDKIVRCGDNNYTMLLNLPIDYFNSYTIDLINNRINQNLENYNDVLKLVLSSDKIEIKYNNVYNEIPKILLKC